MEQISIILPFFVATEKVLQVIAKVVGCPVIKKTLLDKNYEFYNFDPDLPCSDDNIWYIEFNKNEVYYEHSVPINYDIVSLYFKDLNNKSHIWSGLGTNNQNEIGKNFNPVSTFTNIAIAKRLVDFFGGSFSLNGKCIYTKSNDVKYPDINIKNNLNEINFRWNLYHNALNSEPILTVNELNEASEITSFSNKEEDELYFTLLEKEAEKKYNNLNEKIPNKIESYKSKHKI